MKSWSFAVGLACLLMPSTVAAQQPPDAPETALFHFGPLSMTPKIGIRNVGIDTNVFNTPVAPVQDVTGTIAPALDAWLRAGRALISSRTTTEWVMYREAVTERSFNAGENVRIDVDLARVTPRMSAQYLNTRQRPNDEIDVRVQQLNAGGGLGATVHAGSRLTFDVDATRMRFDYADGEYGDPEVALALNRDSASAGVVTKYDLTSLTSLALRVDTIQDRFVYSRQRDGNSLRVMPGVTFRPFALISGSAFVGVRRLRTLDSSVPDYTGPVAAVELKYTALDMLRIIGQVKRDIDYSLELIQPFFVSTSVGVEVTQVLGLNWDVVGRLRRGSLAYPRTAPDVAERIDYVNDFGAGLGRRIADVYRLGFDVDYTRRRSSLVTHTYEGVRVGGSFTYGF